MKKVIPIKRMDNRGASLFIVLMSIIFVTLLASTVMAVALSNLALKQMEKSSKNAFYTAETAVDRIYSGLGDYALDAVGDAYMIQLGEIVTVDPTTNQKALINNAQANRDMKKRFVEQYLKMLDSTAELDDATNKYSKEDTPAAGETTDNIVVFLNNYLTSKGISTTNLSVKSIGKLSATAEDPNYCLTLENVVINYKNQQNYFSDITTDFLIKYPVLDVQFSNGTKPDYLKYGLIAQKNIGFGKFDDDDDPDVVIKGNASLTAGAYAGNNININNGSVVTLSGNGKSVAHKGVNILGGTQQSQLTVNDATLWSVGDILLDQRFTSSLSGKIDTAPTSTLYVDDDLQLDGNSSYADIEGKYYGYGCNASADGGNASLIMNGRFCTLKVKTSVFELLGHAYIDTFLVSDYNTDSGARNKSGYENGESVNVKTAQSIYLVQDRYLKDGVSNPMGISSDLADNDGDGKIDIAVSSLVDMDELEKFFAYDLLKEGNEVVLTKESGIINPNMYYLYYNFKDEASKEQYIAELASGSSTYATDKSYQEEKAVLERGIKRSFYDYGTGNVSGLIDIDTDIDGGAGTTDTKILGAYYTNMSVDGTGAVSYTLKPGNMTKSGAADSAINYSDTIKNTKLPTIYGMMAKPEIYTTIVNTVEVGKLDLTTSDKVETVTFDPDGALGPKTDVTYTLVVTDDGNATVNIPAGNSGIIIHHNSTGTITVNKDFNGLIISSGTIIFKTGDSETVTVSNNGIDELTSAINASTDFYKYLNSFTPAVSEDGFSIESLKYSDIVFIQNWRKFED